MRIAMTLLTVALAIAGCKKDQGGSTGSSSAGSGSGSSMAGSDMGSGSAMAGSGSGSAAMGSGSDMGSGSAMAGSNAGSGSAAAGSGSAEAAAMAHHAGNCPSTVLGATTTDELKGKDVIVTIHSDDKDAIAAIQKRTDELLKEKKDKTPGAGATMHDKKGTHGGAIGLCPIHLVEGATVKAKHDKKGVVVTITVKDKPDELKADIDARIQRAQDWVKANLQPGTSGNQGGVGGGSGDDGSNHSGKGDSKGKERKHGGSGGGKGTGGGGGAGTGGGTGSAG